MRRHRYIARFNPIRDGSRAGRLRVHRSGHDRRRPNGRGFDAVQLLFGELNSFAPNTAANVVAHCHSALADDGLLVLEVHHAHFVEALARARRPGIEQHPDCFPPNPYVCLREAQWDPRAKAAIECYHVILADSTLKRYVTTLQSYSDREYSALLHAAGFELETTGVGLCGEKADDLFVIYARKR